MHRDKDNLNDSRPVFAPGDADTFFSSFCPDCGNNPVHPCDVRGLLHCHSSYCDGAHGLRAMVTTARDLGLDYLGVSDKARTADRSDGLCAISFIRQREEIEAINEEFPDFRLLHGIEVESAADGSLPLSDKDLGMFDYVVATLTNGGALDIAAQTERALRVVRNPYVSILGHPIGEFMTSGQPLPLDLGAVLTAAAEAGLAVEVDANPGHDDLDWGYCRMAGDLGVPLVIASDAHRAARLVDFRHGAEMIRNAGFCCRHILNTMSADDIGDFLVGRR